MGSDKAGSGDGVGMAAKYKMNDVRMEVEMNKIV